MSQQGSGRRPPPGPAANGNGNSNGQSWATRYAQDTNAYPGYRAPVVQEPSTTGSYPASPTGYRQASGPAYYTAQNQQQQPGNGARYAPGRNDPYASGSVNGTDVYQRSVSEHSQAYSTAPASVTATTPGVDRSWTPVSKYNPSSFVNADVNGQSEDAASQAERIAQRHWHIFSQFLGKEREPAQPRMIKAREKLTRLSSTQFQELSTDVYDEVLRRRFAAQGGPGPQALEPDSAFHPKRNQAREKLSTLALTRFRDLVSDVHAEIANRFPRLARGSGISDEGLSRSSVSLAPTSPVATDRAKPNARNTTFIPVKSAMMEEDDDEDDLPLDSGVALSPPLPRVIEADAASTRSSEYDRPPQSMDRRTSGTRKVSIDAATGASESRIRELEAKLAALELTAQEASAHAAGQVSLESALQEALERNDRLESQLQRVQGEVSRAGTQKGTELAQANEALAEQQAVEIEMREAFDKMLVELREMSERESAMQAQLEQLQQALQDQKSQTASWQAQYQKSKLALRQVRVTSAFFAPGGGISGDGTAAGAVAAAAGLISEQGAIQDTAFGQFQAAIDELLRVARSQPQKVLEPMRLLVTATKTIQSDVRQASLERSNEKVGKLMVRLSSTANNLMIACRNHVGSAGLSPVSLVDAAASHLTSTVIELAKICKIKSLPVGADIETLTQTPEMAQHEQETEEELPFTPHEERREPRLSATVGRGADGRPQLTARRSGEQRPPVIQVQPPQLRPSTAQRAAEAPRPPSSPESEEPRPTKGGAKAMNGPSGQRPMTPVNFNPASQATPETSLSKRDSVQTLKYSLEAQTEAIVTSIQKLLSAIRADQKPAVLQQFIGDVVVSVTTATSLLQPAHLASNASRQLRADSSWIKEALETCCARLRDMENGAAEQPADGASKDFKQRLASVAFDTAKQTKELSVALERLEDAQAQAGYAGEPDLR